MNILITGASKGIGYETAMLFSADKNNKIVCVSRSGFNGPNPNANIISIKFDLGNGDIEKMLLPEIKKHISSLDVLINNAGSLINKPFSELSDLEWKTIFEVNIFAVARLTKCLIPLLSVNSSIKNRSHIINISSMGGFQGSSKFPGLSAYSASKAAIANFTECLAVELDEKNVSVNCICPGAVQTEMLTSAFPGAKAQMKPASMAEYLCWFSLNGQRFMNGKIVPVSLSTP